MRSPTPPGRSRLTAAGAGATMLAAALALAACGGGGSGPTKLSMAIGEQGKSVLFTAPKSVKGGLVELDFQNQGKAPHGVQLVQYTGNHSAQDALKVVTSSSNKTPEWVRARGGTTPVAGGQSDTATLNLPAGNYVAVDSVSLGGSPAPPATTQLKVSSGDNGDLPGTDATVKAAKAGKDKYSWDVSGLKAGQNEVTFDSQGSEALHLIGAAPIKGKAPPLSQVKKDFASNGPPPSYIDTNGAQFTPVIDGGSSQTLSLDLKPGRYVFFCPLSDRDGGKSHDQEGLLKFVTVK